MTNILEAVGRGEHSRADGTYHSKVVAYFPVGYDGVLFRSHSKPDMNVQVQEVLDERSSVDERVVAVTTVVP